MSTGTPEATGSQRTIPSTTLSTTEAGSIPGETPSTTVVGSTIQTTSKQCEEMQAVDQTVSKKITVTPKDLPEEEKIKFPVDSDEGASFPANNKRPTISIPFDKPAQVRSVTIPRDITPNANVQQFEVTFYSSDGNKINPEPILSSTSPKDDNTIPARVDSSQIPQDTLVSRVEITIIETTDNKSPQGVVLDIQACTEAATG